jgi:hypothetical protein
MTCTSLYEAVVDSLYESIMVDNLDVCTTLADSERPHPAEKVKSFISTVTHPTIMVYDAPEVHLDNLTLARDAELHVFISFYYAVDR